MNPKQQAAKTAINQLSIHLIDLIDRNAHFTDLSVVFLRDFVNDHRRELGLPPITNPQD
jgi:hypothetical protein